MLSRIQYLVEGIFQSSSRLFHRAGLSPNSLTALGFLLWLVASVLYWGGLSGWEWGAAILVIVIAGFLDAVYAGLAAGALISFWLALWAMSAALMVSYVRARVAAEGVTLKGIGIAERPERLLILAFATLLWPLSHGFLFWGVLLIAVLSSITVVDRVYRASRALSR